MKFLHGFIFAPNVVAVAVHMHRQVSTPLEVTVTSVGNSALKASITNTGSETLKLLKTGSILDNRTIERAEVFSGSDQVSFDGIRLAVLQSNLAEGAFQTLKAGETIETEWDPAEVHDLSNGGDLDFLVRGSFLTAASESTEVTGEIPFSSEIVKSTVNGTTAAKVRRSFLEKRVAMLKRSDLQNDCTGARGQAQANAFSSCTRLAKAAADRAQNGSGERLIEYFGSRSSQVRKTVAGVFQRIADECDSTQAGVAEQYCSDALDYCGDDDGVLAYAVPSMNVMVSCNIYYSALPALTTQCHRQDQATTTLHEVTHLRSVAGTTDLAYGYSLAVQLSTSQALNNADTYTLYANDIDLDC